MFYLEDSLKVSRFSHRGQLFNLATVLVSALLLVGIMASSGGAQNNTMSPYQGESDGVSIGGKWLAFRSEDKMTAAKKVRIELLSDNYLSEDPDYKPRIEL